MRGPLDARPSFSIVSPVLNARAFLPRMLESVRQVSELGVPVEHLIVDGGSTDGSLEIVRAAMSEHGSPIVRVLEGPDRGQAHAINKGLALATGNYVGWLNADDLYVPEGLAKLASAAAESTAEVVLGRCRFIDPSGRIVFAPSPPDRFTPESLLCLLSGWFAGWSIVQPEAFIRRDVFESLGGVEESLHYTMDHHLWVRLASAGARFHSEPVEVARQLVHSGQKTADNIAVAREMLTYASGFLADCPPSDQRAQAKREIDCIASRVLQARRMVSAPDRVLGREPQSQTIVVHGRQGSISGKLICDWSRRCRHHHSVLLAGLSQNDKEQFLSHCSTQVPPVVVGRLPQVTAQFDLVVTTRAGLEGLTPGEDSTALLRPGGSLYVLGASKSDQYRRDVQSIRRAIADRVTFNTHTLLDERISKAMIRELDELGNDREITFRPGMRVRFMPESEIDLDGIGQISNRMNGLFLPALSGSVIIDH